MTDNRIYRTRTLGIPAAGMRDQYADGTAAKLWELYIGDKTQRTDNYRQFVSRMLKENNCKNILDVACGTGVDSIMLLEEGFKLTSVDLSDKMLKYALKTRWKRRKEDSFDKWVIEEANWLTLAEDIEGEGTFDAVICLGNSFAHLPDSAGDQTEHKVALKNFAEMVRPGGVLLIDHRNYDFIIENGNAPSHNMYYNSTHIQDIKTSVLYVAGSPSLVTLDYIMELDTETIAKCETDSEVSKKGRYQASNRVNHFRLSYYPHQLKKFTELLKEAFVNSSEHVVYADFEELGAVKNPGFYIHLIKKAK